MKGEEHQGRPAGHAIHDLSRLSPRESEVLSLAAQGLLDKEIARELGLSLNTLRTYWNRIRLKAGESSRTGLATAWISEELRHHSVPSELPLELEDSWWEFDAIGSRVRASKTISGRVGLSADVWHPFEEYHRLLHPDDLPKKIELVRQVAEIQQPFVSFVERYLLPEGLTHFHTFGQCFFQKGEFISAKGHSVLMQSLADESHLKFGHWTCRPTSEVIELMGDCHELFHLDCNQLWKLDDLRSRVFSRDLESFNRLFARNEGISTVTSEVFRVVAPGKEPAWCRGIGRPQPNGAVTGAFYSSN